MEIIFLLVGLVFVAVGVAIVISEARTRRGALALQGETVGFSIGKGAASDAPFYHCVAEYVGLDGRKRYIESSVGSSSPLGAVGDAVTILARPDDADSAVLESSLTYVVGAALALMGLVSCVIFFATFRANPFSIVSAMGVVAFGAYKLRGSKREKPMSWQAWREYKRAALRPRVFSEETKANIRWADPEAVRTASEKQRRMNRRAIPILVLAGAGLLFLGAHLQRKTARFLERALHAPGVVVDLARNQSSDHDTYAPVVEFEVAGSKHRFKDSISSNPPSYRTGERVAVLYDPDDPRDARIDHGRWDKAIPILIGGFGALLCALGIWLLRRQ